MTGFAAVRFVVFGILGFAVKLDPILNIEPALRFIERFVPLTVMTFPDILITPIAAIKSSTSNGRFVRTCGRDATVVIVAKFE